MCIQQVVPTPLTRLRFWRVVLDEAQMVETASTAGATALAARIDAVHRWAVTGTPISRGLEDLHALLVFLHDVPLADKAWFLRVLQRPYESGCSAGMPEC